MMLSMKFNSTKNIVGQNTESERIFPLTPNGIC
jgi:hypothetical protein